jgi:hypothetical protein
VDHDELLVSVNTGLRHRTAAIRVYYRPVEDDDVAAALETLAGGTLADLTVIQAAGGTPVTGGGDIGISIVTPEEFIEALEGCPLVSWPSDVPEVDRAERTRLRNLQTEAWLESDAFSWLAIVARNKMPYGLGELQYSPDALLERATFRVLTHVLRFGGERLGEAQRGQPVPDAVLTLPGRPALGALLDAKAARDGYVMSRDDQRAMEEYVATHKPSLTGAGIDLRWLVVASSAFPGAPDGRHPYHARSRALEAAGVRLTYVPAGALAALALACEERELTPAEREGLDWPTALDSGQPDIDALLDLLPTRQEA